MMFNSYDLNKKGCNKVFLFSAAGGYSVIVFFQKESQDKQSNLMKLPRANVHVKT